MMRSGMDLGRRLTVLCLGVILGGWIVVLPSVAEAAGPRPVATTASSPSVSPSPSPSASASAAPDDPPDDGSNPTPSNDAVLLAVAGALVASLAAGVVVALRR